MRSFVDVEMGGVGSTLQRQTVAGRSHPFEQICRELDSSSSMYGKCSPGVSME